MARSQEARFFTPWLRPRHVEEFYLPRIMRRLMNKTKVPIGDAVISTPDTCIGAETCLYPISIISKNQWSERGTYEKSY